MFRKRLYYCFGTLYPDFCLYASSQCLTVRGNYVYLYQRKNGLGRFVTFRTQMAVETDAERAPID